MVGGFEHEMSLLETPRSASWATKLLAILKCYDFGTFSVCVCFFFWGVKKRVSCDLEGKVGSFSSLQNVELVTAL